MSQRFMSPAAFPMSVPVTGPSLMGGIAAKSAERGRDFCDSIVAVGVLPPGIDVASIRRQGIGKS